MKLPLPCIVCGFEPEQAFPSQFSETVQVPYAATMFDAGSGHYGSTVWDTMARNRSLTINVCDACLVKRKDRVAVTVTTQPTPDIQFRAWEVGEGG